jgi:hypothetical protein
LVIIQEQLAQIREARRTVLEEERQALLRDDEKARET